MRFDRKIWTRTWVPFLWSRWCYAMMETAPNVVFTCWKEYRFSVHAPRLDATVRSGEEG